MKGIDGLIALRRRGMSPVAACVYIDPSPSMAKAMDDGTGEWVLVGSDEDPNRLDLRAFVGLPVVVHGNDAEPIKRFCAALMKADPLWVLGRYGRNAVVFAEGPIPCN